MRYWNKICGFVLFLTICSLFSHAQSSLLLKLNNTDFLQKEKLNKRDSLLHFAPLTHANITGDYKIKQVIPSDFSTCDYGFFCRKELAIEKASKIPLRFRLGSLRQCNFYEGKKQ